MCAQYFTMQCKNLHDVDIDECASSPCVNGECVDKVNGFTCDCKDGWQGDYCDEDISECASDPCVNGACIEGENQYTCVCEPGFTGKHCDVGKLFFNCDVNQGKISNCTGRVFRNI